MLMKKALLLCALFLQSFANEVDEWVSFAKPDPADEVQVVLAIKQNNRDWLERKLRAVSYPDSQEYGNYMNFDEIAQHVHGRPESVTEVLKTFESHGIARHRVAFTVGNSFAVARLSIQDAESMFSADFYHFKNRRKPTWTTVKSPKYSLPDQLAGHLDFVCCFDKFPREGLIEPDIIDIDDQLIEITPREINEAYKLNEYSATNSQTSQAIAGFLKQYFNPKDLERFQKKYNLPEKPVAKIVGENIVEKPGIEATLDVEYISAVGRNVPTWFISTSTYANDKQEDFLSWLLYLVNTTDAPLVHSVSYGDYEHTIAADYLQRTEDEFKKVGISGRTLLFASGDSGVSCKNGKFTPQWPSSSPYVTAVGGTKDTLELWGSSGGGFSNVFTTPDYQQDALEQYLKRGDAPSSKYYNLKGRAYPDVSAFSVNFIVEYDNTYLPVGGTSCAAPTFAGVVSLLNDVRLNQGMKPLGFLNPLLYQSLKGNGFIDATMGSNGEGFLCPGFKAGKGWDPASGWGAPNFEALKQLIVNGTAMASHIK